MFTTNATSHTINCSWNRTTDSFQVKMERAAAVAAFFTALRQFPFYLYPNRGHSGPLTVFIDLFAFAIIYVCDCFSFCFFLFSLFWFVLLLLYHFFFMLNVHHICWFVCIERALLLRLQSIFFAFFVSHLRLQCQCIACICNSFVQKCWHSFIWFIILF